MRLITIFGDRTCGTFLIIASVSRAKITRSHGPTICECFNSVTSPRVLAYRCVLHSVCFHINVSFGLKPQVDGIKIVRHCLQTIQVEWLIATLIVSLHERSILVCFVVAMIPVRDGYSASLKFGTIN